MNDVEEQTLRRKLAEAEQRIAELERRSVLEPRGGTMESPIDAIPPAISAMLSDVLVGIWHWDLTTNVVRWSESVELLFGLQPGEFAGTYEAYEALVPAEDKPAVARAIEHALETHDNLAIDHRVITPNGERWITGRGKTTRDSHGKPTEMLGIVADITHRKRIEEQLAQAEGRMRAFADASFEGIVFSENGVILDSNAALATMFGYLPGELRGVSVSQLVAPEDMNLVRDHQSSHFAGAYQHRGRRKDGSTVMVEVRGRLVTYQGRQVRMTSLRDVTERIRLEEERSLLEQQLRQAQKMEAIGQLAGGLAHDFNNILMVVLGNLSLATVDLKAGGSPEAILHSLVEAEQCAKRAQLLTSQLLAYSRGQPHQPQLVDLNDTVDELLPLVTRLVPEDIKVSTIKSARPTTALIDPGQLQQIIMNLVVNARDAMPQGGSLSLETDTVNLAMGESPLHMAACGRFVRLTVRDDGCGIAPDVKSRVFEPFFTTKSRGKGTGLGLAVVYGIVNQAEGYVGIESEPGKGTTVELLLPAREVSAEHPKLQTSDPTSVASKGDGELILVCEDDGQVRDVVSRILRDAGYEVLTACDGHQAMDLIAHSPNIDLLITDVIMPDMDGKQLSLAVRKDHPGLHTLYCSGYASNVLSDRGELEESEYFLAKPFSSDVLLSRVGEILATVRSEQAPSAV